MLQYIYNDNVKGISFIPYFPKYVDKNTYSSNFVISKAF